MKSFEGYYSQPTVSIYLTIYPQLTTRHSSLSAIIKSKFNFFANNFAATGSLKVLSKWLFESLKVTVTPLTVRSTLYIKGSHLSNLARS